ncbi:c-type cytochrome [Marinospirillum perlucidum]|uniref:c-type cytochrome n=1 Tax=Marinospirillum perlucidum TaxID=1982602 RepID=UPI001C499D82|nr:c-type cytochrome [Marinospirillum perlucidum]
MQSLLMKIMISSFLLVGWSLPAWALDGDAQRGEAAAAVCSACHQADGSGQNIPDGESWPRLAGMNADYLYKQVKDFQAGTRVNASMQPFAQMLTDQQLRDVAVYYSQLPVTPAAGGETASEEDLAWGEKLATRGDWERYIVPCSSCHGPGNQGAGQHFPGIAGQHAGYLAQQLRAWQNGDRDNDPQHLMAAIAERMNERDIQAVSAWLAQQPAN